MEKPFKINFDKYGHCVVCSLNMITDRVINGDVVQIFTPKKDSLEVLLNNGSRMRICICKDCKKDVKESDYKNIMKKVYRGWEMETSGLVTQRHKNKMTSRVWDKEYQKKYLDRMSELEIVADIEGLPDDIVIKKLKEYKDKEKDK